VKTGFRSVIALASVAGIILVGPGRRAHASELFVTSANNNEILGYDTSLKYDTDHGNPVITISDSHLSLPQGIVFAPNGDLLVANYNTSEILRFDGVTHAYDGVFASTASRGRPLDMAMGPDGDLYVVENPNNGGGDISRYNATTGALIETLPGTLSSPQAIAFDSHGLLYVTDHNDDTVKRYDGTSFTTFANVGFPAGVGFLADGTVLIGSISTNAIEEFNPLTGSYLGNFNATGAVGAMGTSPEGNLYVVNGGDGSIQEFASENPASQSTFVGNLVGGLKGPAYFTFQPGDTMTPEPSAMMLAATALPALGLFVLRRRRRKHNANS
jgi:MYXO-CTERM domain-containing protein